MYIFVLFLSCIWMSFSSHRCSFFSSTDPLLPTYLAPTPDMGLSPTSFTNYFLPEGSDSPLPGGETTTSSAGSPRFLGHRLNENLIPIYCSILAAVVVGLVAYIVFKRSVGTKETRWKAALWLKTLAQLGFAHPQQHNPGQRGWTVMEMMVWWVVLEKVTDIAPGRNMAVRWLVKYSGLSW